jgi:lipid-A-disaccharide synthase
MPPLAQLVEDWQARPERRDVQWVVPVAPTLREADLRAYLKPGLVCPDSVSGLRPDMEWGSLRGDEERATRAGGPPSVLLVQHLGYAARAYADAALVCSGTATLETALLGTPFAIFYKLNPLTYFVAKRWVRIPCFGLANVVAGRQLVPELLQGEVNARRLGQELDTLLEPGTAARMRRELGELRARLGRPGAADRVAEDLLGKMG